MFVERKTYDLGGGKLAASYEIVDDYRNRVQLTPGEVQTLYQYLASKSAQIHNDVNGEVVEDLAARRIAGVGETEEEEFARISLDDAPDEDDPAINP